MLTTLEKVGRVAQALLKRKIGDEPIGGDLACPLLEAVQMTTHSTSAAETIQTLMLGLDK